MRHGDTEKKRGVEGAPFDPDRIVEFVIAVYLYRPQSEVSAGG